MRRLSLFLLLPVFVAGCAGGSPQEGGGNPAQGVGVIDLRSSKMGYSGGFADINGDGKDDLLVGAPDASASPKKGAVLFYLRQYNSFPSSYTGKIMGENEGDNFGFSVARVGDVDGDGSADFAVGAINAEGNAPVSGAAYVYRGGTNPPVLLGKLSGANSFDKFGYSVAGGDINGDGYADIVVSAPFTFTETGFQSGAAYVYFGGTSLSSSPDVTIKGTSVNGNIGSTVAAGDINGDGYADLMISASNKVLVYFGRSDFASFRASNQTASLMVRSDTGGKSGSGFGKSIAYLGDMNGDGIGDFAVGNPNRSVPATYDNMGSVYIFKGSATYPAQFYEDNSTYRLAKITGSAAADRFGSSIAIAGDVDGGGTPDILVGAAWATGGTSGVTKLAGNVYLFKGETVLANPATTYDPSHASSLYPEETPSGEYGRTLAVSRDGLMFSGAPLVDSHGGRAVYKSVARGGTGSNSSASGGGGGMDDGGHVH